MADAVFLRRFRCGAAAPRGGRAGPGLGLCLLLVGLAGPIRAQDAPGWPDLEPLFVERCVMCHSGAHAAAGLHLDSYAGALAGGSNGPVLLAGDAPGSEMIRRLRGESLPRMPFLSYPLEPEQIGLVERWIEAGLPEAEAEQRAAAAPGAGLPED